MSEHGEPLGWLTGAGTDQAAAYALCRCGSGEMTAEASDGSYTTRYRFTRLADMP